MKFRNNVLSLGDDHLVKRVYVGLRDDRGRLGAGTSRNGARWLEKLAADANWSGVILGKADVKEKAREYAFTRQARAFATESAGMRTLVVYAEQLTSETRRGLPEYLGRTCPAGLRHGRRMKTKLRLGVHQLQESLARMVPRQIRTPAHSRCKCCSAGVAETPKHALFECSCYAGDRRAFLEHAKRVHPDFGQMSTDAKLRLLLSENTPKNIDNYLYRFLIQLFSSRERRLASGLAGGRP